MFLAEKEHVPGKTEEQPMGASSAARLMLSTATVPTERRVPSNSVQRSTFKVQRVTLAIAALFALVRIAMLRVKVGEEFCS